MKEKIYNPWNYWSLNLNFYSKKGAIKSIYQHLEEKRLLWRARLQQRVIIHLLSDLENNWHFLQVFWLEGVTLACFCQWVCFLASQQRKYLGLFYGSNLPLELVNNSNGFIKYKFYQMNLNLISQGKAIDAIFLDMSNDFGATSHDIFLSKLGKHVLVSVWLLVECATLIDSFLKNIGFFLVING